MLSKNQRQFFEEIRRSNEITQRRLQRMEADLSKIQDQLAELKLIRLALRELGLENELDRITKR